MDEKKNIRIYYKHHRYLGNFNTLLDGINCLIFCYTLYANQLYDSTKSGFEYMSIEYAKTSNSTQYDINNVVVRSIFHSLKLLTGIHERFFTKLFILPDLESFIDSFIDIYELEKTDLSIDNIKLAIKSYSGFSKYNKLTSRTELYLVYRLLGKTSKHALGQIKIIKSHPADFFSSESLITSEINLELINKFLRLNQPNNVMEKLCFSESKKVSYSRIKSARMNI